VFKRYHVDNTKIPKRRYGKEVLRENKILSDIKADIFK
jgi:hypothetical protein